MDWRKCQFIVTMAQRQCSHLSEIIDQRAASVKKPTFTWANKSERCGQFFILASSHQCSVENLGQSWYQTFRHLTRIFGSTGYRRVHSNRSCTKILRVSKCLVLPSHWQSQRRVINNRISMQHKRHCWMEQQVAMIQCTLRYWLMLVETELGRCCYRTSRCSRNISRNSGPGLSLRDIRLARRFEGSLNNDRDDLHLFTHHLVV
jgi:hypothetical protein